MSLTRYPKPTPSLRWVTLLPNFSVAVIYSVAAADSFTTASVTFLATMLASYLFWRAFRPKPVAGK